MNKNKKILMLLESSFPPDIRVEKEAKALIEAGFDLSIVCANSGDEKTIDDWYGMKIYRVNIKKDILSKVGKLVFIEHLEFYNYLDQLLKNEDFDVIHVHDLKLVPTALKIKSKYKYIKVIADLHENYPAAVREWNKLNKGIKGIIRRYFQNYDRWFSVEQKIVKKVDKIIAVVDEMKVRMLQQHDKLEAEKICVISNLEDKDFVEKGKLDNLLIEKYREYFTILYIGGFGIHRGIDTVIKGMKHIDIPNVKLLLVGRGNPTVEEYFKTLIRENNLENKVEIVGWQPFDKVFTYQKLADICIVPHNSNEHTDNTIPHKLYQYMMVGKPIIVSSCPPLARVTKEANSGLVFEAGNSVDFAHKVSEIYENPAQMKSFSKNGLKYTFDDGHSWQNESKKLIKLYENI